MLSLIKKSIQYVLGSFGYTLVRVPKTNVEDNADQTPPITAELPSNEELIVHLLNEAVDRITNENIQGDIVDCGNGETDYLRDLASALKLRGVTSRRLILFDTSMHPLHRAEKTMPLWGACDLAILLESHKQFKQALGPENFIPSELIDTGYPAKNIDVETHVTDRAIRSKLPRQISILIMNCDTHKANSIILEKVLPQLTKGATIIVRGYTPSIEERNGAIRLLHKHAPDLVLTPVTDDCWAATV